jgi:hypothetical protein
MIVLALFAGTNGMSAGAGAGHWTMPSLLRLLAVIALICAAVYAGLYALAHYVHPKPREISVTIPPDKFFKDR